ncbi:MAG: arginine--tRNA ligase [Candidatus Sumerlaeia bacterium]|nr:arginine--tRNA ligase [Candidatus Sumerlaeia bacterium]
MSLPLNETLTDHLDQWLIPAARQGGVEPPKRESYLFGAPKSIELGDVATSAALSLGKLLKRKPLEVAAEIAAHMALSPLVSSAEPAAPGFVNLRLSPAAYGRVLADAAAEGDHYGETSYGRGRRILLEFVSANPTGPMHVGHLRHAVSGDVLARILSAAGYAVTREFYINDAGNQVQTLGRSFRTRCLQAVGEAAQIEEGMYPGEYLEVLAREFVAEAGLDAAAIRAMPDADIAWEARNRCLVLVRRDLAGLGVEFHNFVSEKALYDNGTVAATVERLKASGATFEKEGAVWLRTTDDGDDQDRVLVKSDGSLTYLVPDLAYHADKFDRGFDGCINMFGADHIGYAARLRSGIKALGHDPSKLEIVTLRLVFLLDEKGERTKGSKRKGDIVEAMEVARDVGMDAARFFLLARSTDSEIEFDLALARQQSDLNPVFKAQYAHARVCSVVAKAREAGFTAAEPSPAAAAHLGHAIERELLLAVAELPRLVERSAAEHAPHHLTRYALGLAELWNRYWSAAKTDDSLRILQPDRPEQTAARLRLAVSVRQALRNSLALLGISAPERLERAVVDDVVE